MSDDARESSAPNPGPITGSVVKQGALSTLLTVVMTGSFHATFGDITITPQITAVFAALSGVMVVVGFWLAKRLKKSGATR